MKVAVIDLNELELADFHHKIKELIIKHFNLPSFSTRLVYDIISEPYQGFIESRASIQANLMAFISSVRLLDISLFRVIFEKYFDNDLILKDSFIEFKQELEVLLMDYLRDFSKVSDHYLILMVEIYSYFYGINDKKPSLTEIRDTLVDLVNTLGLKAKFNGVLKWDMGFSMRTLKSLKAVFFSLYRSGNIDNNLFRRISIAIYRYLKALPTESKKYNIGCWANSKKLASSGFQDYILNDVGIGNKGYSDSCWKDLKSLRKSELDGRLSAFRMFGGLPLKIGINNENRDMAKKEKTLLKQRAYDLGHLRYLIGENHDFASLVKSANTKVSKNLLKEMKGFSKKYGVPLKILKHSSLGPSHEYLAFKSLNDPNDGTFAIEVPVHIKTYNDKVFGGHVDNLVIIKRVGNKITILDYKPDLKIIDDGPKNIGNSFVNAIPQVGGYGLCVAYLLREYIDAEGIEIIETGMYNEKGVVLFNPEWAVIQASEIYRLNSGYYPNFKSLVEWKRLGNREFPVYALNEFKSQFGIDPIQSSVFSSEFKQWYSNNYEFQF